MSPRSWSAGVLLLTGLVTPLSALGMSCDEIVNMTKYDIPESVVIDAIKQSGTAFTSADVACLKQNGAPDSVVAAVEAMAPKAAAPAPEPARAPEPEPEPESRFDSSESLGAGLDDLEEEGGGAVGTGELDRYIRDYKAKKYLTASYGLYQLLDDNSYPEKASTISYYLAKSLHALGMYHGAQHHYMQVVRKGPNNPLFKHALPRLASIAAYTGNDYELLRIVTTIAPESYPRQARPHLYYLMGRKAYEKGDLSDAAAHFSQVPDNHELYPRARYFEGIINYEREKYKSAARSFKEVIRSEVPIDDERVADEIEDLKDLSIMNIGRVYFGLQRYQEADRYYSEVQRDSVYWPESLFERAWTTFYRGDLNHSLGMLLTVDSPYFTEVEFQPEVSYLKALSYFSFCEYTEVERLLITFESRYRPIRAELKGFLDTYRSDEGRKLADQAYDAYFGDRPVDSVLPISMFARMLRKRDLASLVRHIDMMSDEDQLISEQKAQWKNTVGKHLNDVIEVDRQRYKKKAGQFFLQAMLEQYRVIDGLLQDGDVLRFEVVDAQRTNYEFKMANPDADAINQVPIDFATDPTTIYWPFNGEFWQDELGYYRYTEPGACK